MSAIRIKTRRAEGDYDLGCSKMLGSPKLIHIAPIFKKLINTYKILENAIWEEILVDMIVLNKLCISTKLKLHKDTEMSLLVA